MSINDKLFFWMIAASIVIMIQWHAHYVKGGANKVSFWSDIFPNLLIGILLLINTLATKD